MRHSNKDLAELVGIQQATGRGLSFPKLRLYGTSLGRGQKVGGAALYNELFGDRAAEQMLLDGCGSQKNNNQLKQLRYKRQLRTARGGQTSPPRYLYYAGGTAVAGAIGYQYRSHIPSRARRARRRAGERQRVVDTRRRKGQ